jgi:hypothetical protein
MNPMSAAIKNRRMQSAPVPEAGQEAAPEQADPLQQIVATLEPDDKMKLMQMLQTDMQAQPEGEGPGLTDEQGGLKSTPGEQAELEGMHEQGEQIMGAMGEPEESGPQASSFTNKIRMNAKKLFGKGK